MRNSFWLFAIAVCVSAVFLGACRPDVASVPVPKQINTVADGYPFALQLKDQAMPEADLVLAQVYLDRKDNHFEAQTINYCFVSKAGSGRTLVITLVNGLRKAYVSRNSGGLHQDPYFSSGPLQPLALSSIDVPQVLELATTNGLNDFCARASGQSGEVSLRLGSSTNGSWWLLKGEGWENKEGIPGLHLKIDARTGDILDRDFENPTGHH